MSVIVTLDLYSGLPNPSWELTEAEAVQLRSLLAARRKLTRQTSPGSLGRLGYRGLIVTQKDAGQTPELRAFDGILESASLAQPNVVDDDSEIEMFLVGTAGTALKDDERQFIQDEITKNVKGGSGNSASDFDLYAAPPYDAGKWNNDPHVRQNNNCYNYANDKITNTFAQPGRASGYAAPYPPTCGGTGEGAVLDRLVSIPNPDVTPAEGHICALVVASHPAFKDYHWYRRDNNNMWSHKPGQTEATNKDNAGRLISDPRTCDRGFYTQFCGFYNAIPARTRIR
jgi:hypothetical protein